MTTPDPKASYAYLQTLGRSRAAQARSHALAAEAATIAGDLSGAAHYRSLERHYAGIAADYRRWAWNAPDAPRPPYTPEETEATP